MTTTVSSLIFSTKHRLPLCRIKTVGLIRVPLKRVPLNLGSIIGNSNSRHQKAKTFQWIPHHHRHLAGDEDDNPIYTMVQQCTKSKRTIHAILGIQLEALDTIPPHEDRNIFGTAVQYDEDEWNAWLLDNGFFTQLDTNSLIRH